MLEAAVRVSLHIRIHNRILQSQRYLKSFVYPIKIYYYYLNRRPGSRLLMILSQTIFRIYFSNFQVLIQLHYRPAEIRQRTIEINFRYWRCLIMVV
jgi:hypothetical protein